MCINRIGGTGSSKPPQPPHQQQYPMISMINSQQPEMNTGRGSSSGNNSNNCRGHMRSKSGCRRRTHTIMGLLLPSSSSSVSSSLIGLLAFYVIVSTSNQLCAATANSSADRHLLPATTSHICDDIAAALTALGETSGEGTGPGDLIH